MRKNKIICRRARLSSVLLLLLILPHCLLGSPGAAIVSTNDTSNDTADVDPELVKILVQNRRMMKLENGWLAGEGAQFLVDQAGSSQFFLIGEDHGFADLPILTAALFSAINPLGYRNFATETGTLTAAYVEKLARQPQAEKAFAGFNAQYPFGIPFYNWKEEARMAAAIVEADGGKGRVLWGLDQEFIMSSAFHFKRLAELAPDAKAKQVVDEYYSKIKTEFARIIKSKNPQLAFLSSAKGEDFDKLDAAFKGASAEAKTILSELRQSREIYQKNFDGRGYDSNLQRSILMKRHFIAYYNNAARLRKTPPRVLFKFGANHVKRGKNFTNVYDIGNFVSELAVSHGSTSFHLFVLPIGGTQNAYVPFLENVADKEKKVVITESSGFFDARPFLQTKEGKDWAVIDLRPLRPLVHSGKLKLPRGFADLVWGFDAVLVMPETKASTLFEIL